MGEEVQALPISPCVAGGTNTPPCLSRRELSPCLCCTANRPAADRQRDVKEADPERLCNLMPTV